MIELPKCEKCGNPIHPARPNDEHRNDKIWITSGFEPQPEGFSGYIGFNFFCTCVLEKK